MKYLTGFLSLAFPVFAMAHHHTELVHSHKNDVIGLVVVAALILWVVISLARNSKKH